MSKIKITRPDKKELEEKGVLDWPIWEKEESEFPWHYDSKEQCYLLKGQVEVETEDGEKVEFGKGDFVTFPAGMDCRWKISERVKKHYRLG